MKSFIVFMLSSSILISSCSSTHLLLNYNEIKEEIEGINVVIILKNSEEIEGKIIEIGVDSTFNKNLMLKEGIVIPTSEIKELLLRDHGQGVVDGLLVGVGIGFFGGAIAGASLIGESFTGRGSGFGWWIILITGGIAGIGSGILGMPVGAIIGHKDNYIFSSSLPHGYVKLETSAMTRNFSYSLKPQSFIRTDMIRPEQFMTISWKGNTIDIISPLVGDRSNEKNNNKPINLAALGKFKEAEVEFADILKIDTLDMLSKISLDIFKDVNNLTIKSQAAVLFFRGLHNCLNMEFDKAFEKINQIILLHPDYIPFYFLRGNIYLTLKSLDLALDDFNIILKLNPNDMEACNSRGIALFNKDFYNEAISNFEKIIQSQPSYFPAYFNKAQCFEKTGQFNEALEAYKLFLQKSPPQYIYHIEYARKNIKKLESNKQEN